MAKFRSHEFLLRTIAVLKFLKAALLAATGIETLRLVKKDVFGYAAYLVGKYHLNPGNRFVAQVLARAANVTPRRLHELGIVAFVYAALFFAEGIGLWSLKRWGEWLTVVITGSLLPFEVYELWRRFTFSKTVVLAINVAVVWYLAMRLKRDKPAS